MLGLGFRGFGWNYGVFGFRVCGRWLKLEGLGPKNENLSVETPRKSHIWLRFLAERVFQGIIVGELTNNKLEREREREERERDTERGRERERHTHTHTHKLSTPNIKSVRRYLTSVSCGIYVILRALLHMRAVLIQIGRWALELKPALPTPKCRLGGGSRQECSKFGGSRESRDYIRIVFRYCLLTTTKTSYNFVRTGSQDLEQKAAGTLEICRVSTGLRDRRVKI